MKKIILIGGGGHCRVVLDALLDQREFKVAGIIDKKINLGRKVLGVPIIGDDSDLVEYYKKGIGYAFIAVGSIGKPTLRIRLFNLSKQVGFKFPNVIHQASVISRFSEIGIGNYIGAGAIINPGAKIGNNCIINTGAIIEHDCVIGDFVHIGPGAVLSGMVRVGDGSHLGSGSSVLQCLKIGTNSVIGIRSAVIDDIEDNVVACGNPCRKIKDNE